jgi:hypothetical protein
MKIKFSGLSLKWNNLFIRNLVIVIGVVLVWRGVWNIAETYLLPNYPTISSIISIAIGVLILYLPDELKQL